MNGDQEGQYGRRGELNPGHAQDRRQQDDQYRRQPQNGQYGRREHDGNFSRWLDATIENNRIKARDIARRVGVTDSAVSRWRNGTATPGPATTAELARVLGVDPVRLVVTAGHIPGDSIGVEPYTVPESVERRKRAKAAFDAIKGLTKEGRRKLLETYDEVAREQLENEKGGA